MSFSSIPTLLSALMVSELSYLQKCLRKQALRSRKMLSFSKENSHHFCHKSPFSSLKELNTKLQYTLLHTSGLSLLTGWSLYIYICISAHLYLHFYLYLLICNPKVDKFTRIPTEVCSQVLHTRWTSVHHGCPFQDCPQGLSVSSHWKELLSWNKFSSVQSLSCVWLFVTPWTAARQAFLSITNSWSLLKLMSIELVMPSSHLILCRLLLLLPSIFPSIRVFSKESFLPSGGQSTGVSASASVLPLNIEDWFPLGWTGPSLQSKGLSRVFSSIRVQKHQFFGAQLME